MEKYGFQGTDLDWEYPATNVRGGRAEDIANLVLLCQELRAAFGTKYGLSSILAPDYWYLRGMDPKGMEPYLDFFGFMAYDLHGFWDADVKTLGSIVRPQTDIREIDKNTLPLWFDKLDPAKVNLEIEEIIRTKGLYPEYLSAPKIKKISWDDEWIGYDDAETTQDKIALANDRCMGGTTIWSVDFDSGAGSGDIPDGGASTGGGDTGGGGTGTGTGSGLVPVDSNIWTTSEPKMQYVPPCILVLPPIPLPQMSTSFPPFTTSYLLQMTTTLSGQVVTTQVTKQTILTVAPVTTSEIELWAVTIFTDDPTSATFTAVQSVTPSPIVVTLPASADFRPFPTPTGSGATSSPTAPPLGFTSSHAVTIQPQPTYSFSVGPIPILTYSSGKPESTCTSNCGEHTCRVFGCGGGCPLFGCGKTCGTFGCGGGCGTFGCGGGCGTSGCGSSNCPGCGPGPPPESGGDQTGQEENPDEEDDGEEQDRESSCVLMEADLEPPNLHLHPPIRIPSLPPAPEPPTEDKECYDSGSWVNRESAIAALNSFCSRPEDADVKWSAFPHYGGYVMKDNEFVEYRAPACLCCDYPVNIIISVQALNGCEFEIDGPSPEQECGRIIRQILDKCDTVAGEAAKQGGKVESNCAIWRFDPGFSHDRFVDAITFLDHD
ncbi:MAG: hypothetical protein Q9207_007992, partial [Kuettlingeria erythrocarpa]